jgi:hypothetical protein
MQLTARREDLEGVIEEQHDGGVQGLPLGG